MSKQRRDDPPQSKSKFRSDRLHKENGKWYFTTREGSLEGPFEDKVHALNQLETYINVMKLNLVESDSDLAKLDRPLYRLD